MPGTPVVVRLDEGELAKLDRLAGALRCESRPEVFRQFLRQAPDDGEGLERPRELVLPQDAKARRLYQAFIDSDIYLIKEKELGEYGFKAAIRTERCLRKTMEILKAQGFIYWDSDVKGWRRKKKWKENP